MPASQVELSEQLAPRIAVGQIAGDAFHLAGRPLAHQPVDLVGEQIRQVDLHPLQRRRQLQAVWPSVEASHQVDHHIRTFGQVRRDHSIDHVGAGHDRPTGGAAGRKGAGDRRALDTGEPGSERIPEDGIWPSRLLRPTEGDPARGFREGTKRRALA
jgi:hypothetical protein